MKEKIAIITKAGLADNPSRLKVIEALENEGSFDVYQIGIDDVVESDTPLAVVFGGDGTMLEAVRMTEGKNVALLGVNLGNLGFLTACEKDAPTDEVLRLIKTRKCVERMLLDVSVCGKRFAALNEIVLKGANSRPIFVDLSIDGRFVDSYHSDGAIVSSPTGSTAYSLSAGGPVLAPDVKALVVNPICAHSLHSRPLVVGSDASITLTLYGSENANVFVDGRHIASLRDGDCVRVAKSLNTAKFVTSDNDDFYKKLLQKMNVWGVTAK